MVLTLTTSIGSLDMPFSVQAQAAALKNDASSDSTAGFTDTVNSSTTAPFNQGDKTSYQVPSGEELADGTYYWRVRTFEPINLNYSDWSATRTFDVHAIAPSVGSFLQFF
jgi:hypothetical protein